MGGQGFAVDANLISADVQKQNSCNPEDWEARVADANDAQRAVQEYLDTLDDQAFGAATTTKPKFTAHADPASQWTAARKGPDFFAYSKKGLWRGMCRTVSKFNSLSMTVTERDSGSSNAKYLIDEAHLFLQRLKI